MLKLPGEQKEHDDDPVLAVDAPVGHTKQFDEPVALLILPTGQSVQLAEPFVLLY